jgi:hypothetical protein
LCTSSQPVGRKTASAATSPHRARPIWRRSRPIAPSGCKMHQMYVDRLALIASHDWQHWLVDTLRMFLHPEAKAFDKGRESEAMQWIAEP